jgi:hypothetical protein
MTKRQTDKFFADSVAINRQTLSGEEILMGKRFDNIGDQRRGFIEQQKMFFVGTADSDGRVNVSPKGMDSLKVIDDNRVVWLNVTGSGNETAAHLIENDRMTLMFCAFEGSPMILRLYGHARVIHPRDDEWNDLFSMFRPIPGARQIMDMQVDLVQESCGMAVPLFDFHDQRDLLWDWAERKGEQGLHEYWENRNQVSIDGKSTRILNEEPVTTTTPGH